MDNLLVDVAVLVAEEENLCIEVDNFVEADNLFAVVEALFGQRLRQP